LLEGLDVLVEFLFFFFGPAACQVIQVMVEGKLGLVFLGLG